MEIVPEGKQFPVWKSRKFNLKRSKILKSIKLKESIKLTPPELFNRMKN